MKSAATSITTFHVGATVWVNNERTGNTPRAGTIATIAKGWYNVLIDNPAENEKPIVSARIGSLSVRKAPLGDDALEALLNEEDIVITEEITEETIALDDEDIIGDEPEEIRGASKGMKEALNHARASYVKAKRPNGTATAHNGDTIARALADLEPAEVAMMADVFLQLPKGTLLEKYQRLNPGQIRMNCGNRIRGVIRKLNEQKQNAGDIDVVMKAADEWDRLNAILEQPMAAVQAWNMAEFGTDEYEILTEDAAA